MKKINNNARGANRRGRRTMTNFRARSVRPARTVTLRAKTGTIPVLAISNVPSDILEAIDELATRQDRCRSSFVRRELERIVARYPGKECFARPLYVGELRRRIPVE